MISNDELHAVAKLLGYSLDAKPNAFNPAKYWTAYVWIPNRRAPIVLSGLHDSQDEALIQGWHRIKQIIAGGNYEVD